MISFYVPFPSTPPFQFLFYLLYFLGFPLIQLELNRVSEYAWFDSYFLCPAPAPSPKIARKRQSFWELKKGPILPPKSAFGELEKEERERGREVQQNTHTKGKHARSRLFSIAVLKVERGGLQEPRVAQKRKPTIGSNDVDKVHRSHVRFGRKHEPSFGSTIWGGCLQWDVEREDPRIRFCVEFVWVRYRKVYSFKSWVHLYERLLK